MHSSVFYRLFVIAFAAVIFLGCEKKQEVVPKKEIIPKVDYTVVKRQKLPIWADFVGKTQGSQSVDHVARVKGYLEKTHFHPGDYVKKGQLLFTIQKDQYLADLNYYKAQLAKNQASLKLAKDNVKRYTPLVKKQLASVEKLDELVARQKEVEAMIAADKANIANAQLNLNYCSVRAENSGRISRWFVDPGNLVGTTPENSKLATVITFNPMWAYFYPSNETMQLIMKHRAQDDMKTLTEQPDIKLDGKTIFYKGHVDYISNTTNKATGTVTMRTVVDNKEYALFPGTFVDVHVFITDQVPIIAVSPDYIRENQLGAFVYIIGDDGRLKQQSVVYHFSNKDFAIIESGLRVGDKLVLSDSVYLKDKQKVEPVRVNYKITTSYMNE